MKTINIGKDYSVTPLGRFPDDGDFSGERFRDGYLLPAMKTGDKVEVVIDGVEGYGSSFLDEAFGGLVREGHFTAKQLRERMTVSFDDEAFRVYEALIWKYIDEAKKK